MEQASNLDPKSEEGTEWAQVHEMQFDAETAEEQETSNPSQTTHEFDAQDDKEPANQAKTSSGHSRLERQIFVGGIPSDVTSAAFRAWADQTFPGCVVNAVLVLDRLTHTRSRGFGFVTFDNPQVAEQASKERLLSFGSRFVEIKRAQQLSATARARNNQQQNASRDQQSGARSSSTMANKGNQSDRSQAQQWKGDKNGQACHSEQPYDHNRRTFAGGIPDYNWNQGQHHVQRSMSRKPAFAPRQHQYRSNVAKPYFGGFLPPNPISPANSGAGGAGFNFNASAGMSFLAGRRHPESSEPQWHRYPGASPEDGTSAPDLMPGQMDGGAWPGWPYGAVSDGEGMSPTAMGPPVPFPMHPGFPVGWPWSVGMPPPWFPIPAMVAVAPSGFVGPTNMPSYSPSGLVPEVGQYPDAMPQLPHSGVAGYPQAGPHNATPVPMMTSGFVDVIEGVRGMAIGEEQPDIGEEQSDTVTYGDAVAAEPSAEALQHSSAGGEVGQPLPNVEAGSSATDEFDSHARTGTTTHSSGDNAQSD